MKLLIVAAPVLLAGCAGLSYAVDTYGKSPVQHFHYAGLGGAGGDTYRIFDLPEQNRLMITPSLAAAAGQGFVGGMTLGIVQAESPSVVYRDAARAWLASTGRNCTTGEASELVNTQYEVSYTCT